MILQHLQDDHTIESTLFPIEKCVFLHFSKEKSVETRLSTDQAGIIKRVLNAFTPFEKTGDLSLLLLDNT